MAHRSQCSSAGDNPLDPNYLPPHYREEYRMAIDVLVDADLEGYYGFLQEANVVDFLSYPEIEYIKCTVQAPYRIAQPERRYMAEDVDGSSDTYWPVHSDLDAPSLDLGWPQQLRFVGPTEVTTLVNPSDPEMPSIKEQVRRMIKTAQQVVAVVMDMFTDVDIFADIIGAAMRGVAVYILLDELNAHHFVAMVNNCRVNLDEIKSMRVRTVSGTTYFCHTGKSFKGQMMDRFILVDCRAVLTGNYSFMWSFEKIHRCLAHLFLGQLVTTFDEEFRILYAHSEPLVVEHVLANISRYSNVHGSYFNVDKTHIFKKEYPTMPTEWAECSAEGHINVGHQMLPFIGTEPCPPENPSIHRHMNLHATQQFREDHPFIEHGRQMRGPNEMANFKRHSYPDVPEFEYMPPQHHPALRGKQFMEGGVAKGSHFAREPGFYQAAGVQPEYDMHGRFRGQGYHRETQFSGAGYPHEVNEAEQPGAYDHVQRYLQSQSAMEEGHGARNVLTPVQSNPRRHSMGQSYACQTSPMQSNLPDQKRFFNVNRKPQDVSKKQGLRDWRISSYLSTFDDGEEMDFSELEGSDLCDNIPCFIQEGPYGPIGVEIPPGNIEFNRRPSSRNNHPFVQIQNSSPLPDSSVDLPLDLSEHIKITPTTTSESSCTTEGDKVEEKQNKEPKETSLFAEEFLRRKPTRAVQRGSRLRHSLIFSSNLELNTSEESKDILSEKDGDETSKLSARVSHILDKRRATPREPFQWSSFVRSATVDDQAIESAHSENSLNKIGASSDKVDKVDNCQDPLQEKKLPETVQAAVLEEKSKGDEPNVWQRSAYFIDMNDPDCRLRYFKELAAKRKAELAAVKASQSKSPKNSDAPEKLSTSDAEKKLALTTSEKQNTNCEESGKDILHRATDAEKIRFKKKLAEESGLSSHSVQNNTDPTSNPVVETSTVSESKNQSTSTCTQKPLCGLSGKTSQPVTGSPSKPCSRDAESISAPAPIESSFPQNQVDCAALNTASAETMLTQNYISKETGPSHALPTESCPPVNLSKTKCMSPLSTTTNESGNDSQTPAQKSPKDSSSKQNLATVDTCLTPINIGPSQTFSTTGSSVSQHLYAAEKDSSQKPIAMIAESSQQPNAKGSEPAQKCSVTEAEPFQAARVADASQQPTTTESKSFQHPTVTKAESNRQPTLFETDPSPQLTAAVSESFQHPPATGTDSSQQPPAVGVHNSKIPTATENEHAQKFTATEAKSPQHSSATENEHVQKPTATEAESLQHPLATENEHAQKPTASEAKSSQQPAAAESKSFQNSTATANKHAQPPTLSEMDSSQQPTAMGVQFSKILTATENKKNAQKPTATEAESLQHPPATENEHAQKPTATEAESLQHPPATENEHAQKPTATEAVSLQHPSATENEYAQKPNATEAVSLQEPHATENEHAQKPTSTEAESFQHPPAKEAKSFQQPTAAESEPFQKLTIEQADCLQQPMAIGAESFQISTSTEADVSQQATAEESEPPTAKGGDSFQKPTALGEDSSQHPTTTGNELSQHPTETDSFKQPNESGEDFSQDPAKTGTDSSHKATVKERDSPQNPTTVGLDTSKHPIATDDESFQRSPFKVTLSPQSISFSDTVSADSHMLFQIGAVTTSTIETNLAQNIAAAVCTIQDGDVKSPEHGPADSESSPNVVLSIATSSDTSLSHETSSSNIEQMDSNFCQDFGKQGSIPTTSITQADNRLSQNIIIDLSSSPEHSQFDTSAHDSNFKSDIAKSCPQTDDSKMELNSSLEQTQAKPSLTPLVKDTDNVITSLHSVELSSTQPHGSPEPCLSSTGPVTTQGFTQLQSNTSLNPVQESTCLNDPKPEDERQKHEDDKEQPQRHDSSARPEPDLAEDSTVSDPIQIDRTKQITPKAESSVTNLAEVSETSECSLTPQSAENAKYQSPMAQNPKLIMSAHQSSTANVISCSNLRDDTKVLLEQISAKNQSRASQSKQTLAASNEEKEGGVNSAGQQFSSHSGGLWSSKASPEEREMLLQKMERMRKERKVYSRFEAS